MEGRSQSLADEINGLLASSQMDVAEPCAPPEFWRAIFDSDSEYSGRRVRWDRFEVVWNRVDLQRLSAEDQDLLCALQECHLGRQEWNRTFQGSCPNLVVSDYLNRKIDAALDPKVRECRVLIEGDRVHMVPLPLTGRAGIPKYKVDAIRVDREACERKGMRPRLSRIQGATKFVSADKLLAEARRGCRNPKAHGDKPSQGKIEVHCPLPSHPDEVVSAWVMHYPDGFGGGCACEGWPSNYVGVIQAYNPHLSEEQCFERAEEFLGLSPWHRKVTGEEVDSFDGITGPAPADDVVQIVSEIPANPAQAALVAPQPPATTPVPVAPAQPPTPKVNHIVSWLRKQLAVGVAEESWMVSRSLTPAVQAKCFLSRSPAPRTTPDWNGREIGDEDYLSEAAEIAAKTGHTLITLTYDEMYQPVGVRFRRTMGAHKAKTKSPTVYRAKKSIPLPQRGVGLNNVALLAGQGKLPWPEWTIITEGEPDARTAAELYPDAGVVEIHRGKNAWTKEFASTIPNKSKIALLTDTDKIGRKYRRDVIRSLGKRVEFWDFPGRWDDLNQLLMDGKQADLALDKLKKIPVGEEREHTDLGNARRLHDEYEGELAYANGRWHVVKDGVWEQQGKDAIEVRRRIQAIAEGIVEEAEIVASDEGAKQTAWWGKKSQSSGAVTACLTEARVLFAVDEKAFDKDPFLIGAGNGVVDLRTGELLEDPGAAMVSRRAPIVFEPFATCPRWLRFLDEIFLGDQELTGYMRRTVGYFLTSSCREQKFWLWHGHQGGNGKGTFLGVCQKLLGTYAAPFRTSLLCRRPGQAGWDLSALEGLKLAYLNEKDDDTSGKVSVETLKNLASEDTLYGEKKRQDPRPFQPTHKIVWALNTIPPLPHDPALFRRLQLVPFLAHFPRPDEKLAATLEGELPGILAWAVQGAVEWYRDGLQPPAVVQAGGQDLLEEADVVGRWIAAECVVDQSVSTERTRLHDHFTAWASMAKVRSQGASEFYAELERKGFKKGKRGNDRVIRGIRLVPVDGTQIEWGAPAIGQPVPTPEQIDTVIAEIESRKPN